MVSVCTTCKGLQKSHLALNPNDAESAQWVNTTLPSLRQSSTGGCRACALLLQGILLHHQRFAGVDEKNIRVTAESFNWPEQKQSAQEHLSVDIRWQVHDSNEQHEHHDHSAHQGYPDLRLEFFTDRDGQSPFTAIGLGRRISDNPLQDRGLETAKGMIGQCLARHSRCRSPRPLSLPKRVLDVSAQDGAQGVRLHESNFDSHARRYEQGEYLTLSHCWGIGKSVLKTTTSTLSSHRKGIAWSSLPRTFQDAVSITRSLGFRWLWIDSLCIVQDDPTDHLSTASELADIYSNSFLTIAATSAADSTGGCILPKPQPFKIQVADSRGSANKIHVREQPSHYSFKAPFSSDDHMNDWMIPFGSPEKFTAQTPLLKRAWAYVERLLSPRVLHFTQSEMIMECREGFQCECGRIDDSVYDSRPTDTVKQDYANIVNQGEMNGITSQLAQANLQDGNKTTKKVREEALEVWSYIITEYTARDLTYEEDRLLAISSIAKQFAPILKSGYMAGQWTFSTLNLLWYPDEPELCRRPRSYNTSIPSWSWASVTGSQISFDNRTAMDLACTAAFTEDVNAKSNESRTWLPTIGGTVELSAAMATEVSLRIDALDEISLVKNNISVDFKPDVISSGNDELVSGETLTCVFASMTFRTSIIGLVLKATTTDPGVYRRVGRFECYECYHDGDDEQAEDAESLFEHWFPEIEDMTVLDDAPKRTFIIA